MKEILELSVQPVNIVPTVLLMIMVLYWLLALIGLFDFGKDFDLSKDFDVDVDIDADIDVDADVDADADAEGSIGKSAGGMKGLLKFFNLGEVPFMMLLSFFALFWWSGSVMSNYYLGNSALWLALLLLLPMAIAAALLAKVLSTPFKGFYKKLNTGEEDLDLTGKLCELTTSLNGDSTGQAELWVESRHLLIYVKSLDGEKMNRGEQVFVVSHEKESSIYFVKPFND